MKIKENEHLTLESARVFQKPTYILSSVDSIINRFSRITWEAFVIQPKNI